MPKKKKTKRQLAKIRKVRIELTIFTLLLCITALLGIVVGQRMQTTVEPILEPVGCPYPEDLIDIIVIPQKEREPIIIEPEIEYVEQAPEPISQVEQLIETKALAAGMSQSETNRFINIAYCESKLDPAAQNGVSSAAGVFQIIRGTWNGNSNLDFDSYKYDANANIDTAIDIYQHRGFQPWACNNLV